MALQAALRVAKRLVASQIPNNELLVARRREKHIGTIISRVSYQRQGSAPQAHAQGGRANILLAGGGQGGDPAIVALEGAAKNERASHDCDGWICCGKKTNKQCRRQSERRTGPARRIDVLVRVLALIT